MTNPVPPTATVDRAHLVEALDTLADVAHAIDRADDAGVPVADGTALVIRLREIITSLSFEVEASDFLAGLPDQRDRPAKRDAAWKRRVDADERLRQADVRHDDEREAILDAMARHGDAAPSTCLYCRAVISSDHDGRWAHLDGSACPHEPEPADRRPDLHLRLRVDPDAHPLVWEDEAEDVVVVLFGEKGAGVSGISATIAFPTATARRWITELLRGFRQVLAEVDQRQEPA